MKLLRLTSSRSWVFLLAPLAACTLGDRALTGECPRGEVCSPSTPDGLDFGGASLSDFVFSLGSNPTLVGGTQAILLEDLSRGRPLSAPYLADDEGGSGVKVDHTSGAVVTVRGVSERSNYLRITSLDGELLDRKKLAGAVLTEIRLRPRGEQVAPTESIVLSPGQQELVVALVAESEGASVRAVDESMVVELPGATRSGWDLLRLAAATVGHHTLTVTAGDLPAAEIDVEVVAGADEVVAQAVTSPFVAGKVGFACFSAHAAGRHVAGLPWTFAVDNGSTQIHPFARNCTAVTPDHAGALTITATAGGQTGAATVAVGAAQARLAETAVEAPEATSAAEASRTTTAGERAAAAARWAAEE